MLLLRKYLIGSLIAHLLILIIASLAGLRTHSIKQTFVVFGARSGKPTSTTYKSLKTNVPFVSESKKNQASQIKTPPAKKIASAKPTKQKKAAPKKTPPKKTNSKKKSISKIAPLKEVKQPKAPKKHDKKAPVEKKGPPKTTKPKVIEKKVPKKEQPPVKEKPQSVEKQKQAEEMPQPIKIEEAKPIEKPKVPAHQEELPIANSVIQLTQSVDQPTSPDQEQDLGTIVLGGNDTEQVTEYQKVINQEAARVWRPPLGVPQGTTCFVTFTIARDGSHESDLTQKSPVIIYDLSVMRAARAMKFPKSLWGKQFKIAFHQ